jgi:hypothetical protein
MDILHMNSVKHNVLSGIKRYINEFFILFLAITASFFVENFRESVVERHRENQYIASLISDLQTDTTEMTQIQGKIKVMVKGIDSLLRVLEKPENEYTISRLYYYSFKYLGSASLFNSTDRTITQLKNAGGLRLIQKDGASDSIMIYYNLIENLEYNTEFNLKLFDRILTMMKEMFEFKALKFCDINPDHSDKNLKIHMSTSNQMNVFYNEVMIYGSSLKEYNILLKEQHKKAEKLIAFLKDGYDLD